MGVGRPAKKTGKAAAAKRASARKSYNAKSVAERQALVQNRDKAAQRKADAKRLSTQRSKRNAYHRADAKATAGVPAGTKCASCGSTKNIQRHVKNGKFSRYLCGRCNVKAIKEGT